LEFAYFLGSGTISTSTDIVSLGAPVLTYLLDTNSYVDILHTRLPFFSKQQLFTVIIVLVKYYNILKKLEFRIRIFFFVGCFK
jgi:hypothetical protein